MSRRSRNTVYRKLRRAYSQDVLEQVLTRPETDFGFAYGMQTFEAEEARAPEDYYHFKNNGSRVLATAHLDTVVRPKERKPHFFRTEHGPALTSGALDDRLGAYVILELLPQVGVTCDWLLTVGEESCRSTAEWFNPQGKDYDWIIEFDRAGTDVVMYQYEDAATTRLVEEDGGPRVGDGSFSDIAVLEHLGVKGFNWGVGYGGNYHSKDGYAYLTDTFSMVRKYLKFHERNYGTRLVHESQKWESVFYGKYDKSRTHYIDCPLCGVEDGVDADLLVCDYCEKCIECRVDMNDCYCYSDSLKKQSTQTVAMIHKGWLDSA